VFCGSLGIAAVTTLRNPLVNTRHLLGLPDRSTPPDVTDQPNRIR